MFNEIKYLFPNAIQLVDFELRDDSNGAGPYIAEWNESKLGPKPTKEALSTVSVAAQAAATARDESDKAKAALVVIDLASIRAIREWLVSQPTAPQLLKDRDTAAALERAKAKP